MSEHDEPAKPALQADNPDPPKGPDGEKGLGTDVGADVTEPGSDVIDSMPEARGEVRYPDVEEPDEMRPDVVPMDGHVEEDPDTATDASTGAKD